MTFPRGEGKESVKTNLVTFVCLDCGYILHKAYKGETQLEILLPYIEQAKKHADSSMHRVTMFMSVQWVYTGAGLHFANR